MDLIGIGWLKVPLKPIEEPKPKSKQTLSLNLMPEKVDIRKVFHQFVNHFPPHLRWISFHKDGLLTAEVLMSAELIHLSVPTLTVKEVEKNEPIPIEIRPDMRKFRMEIIFAGIRGAQKLSHFSSGRYKIELTMGDLKLSSGFSGKGYKTNLNFIDPYASGYLLLPEQFQFWPPIIVKHLDCSHKKPTVLGAAMIRRPEKFFVEDKPKQIQRFLPSPSTDIDVEAQKLEETFEMEETKPLLGTSIAHQSSLKLKRALASCRLPKFLDFSGASDQSNPMTLESQYSWWTKFYNSNRNEEFRNDCLHQLTVKLIPASIAQQL